MLPSRADRFLIYMIYSSSCSSGGSRMIRMINRACFLSWDLYAELGFVQCRSCTAYHKGRLGSTRGNLDHDLSYVWKLCTGYWTCYIVRATTISSSTRAHRPSLYNPQLSGIGRHLGNVKATVWISKLHLQYNCR